MQNNLTIDVLRARTSCSHLTTPGPSEDQLQTLFQIAARAADHRVLKPWRYLVIEGAGRDRLGKLFLEARLKQAPELSEEEKTRIAALPQRAPTLIVAIACLRDDPKVPAIEQFLSTGAGVQNMLNAAFAMGLGSIWRTGDLAYDPWVAKGLGLAEGEHIVGFLYLGTPRIKVRPAEQVDINTYVSRWP